MRAIGINQYGGPEALEQVELPTPHAGTNQVRVRVQAAAVNPADVMLRDGLLAEWYGETEPPFVPGMDIAGVVDEIASDVDHAFGLFVGQHVVGIVDNHGQCGGYSEYVALPAESVTASPKGAAPAEAASFLMPALTARTALDLLQLPAGSTLLVAGAAGGVGRYAVALAHDEGVRVIAVADAREAELLRRLGAEVVIGRSDDVAVQVRAMFPEGVDAVFDNTTAPEMFLPAVRDGGQYASPRGLASDPGRDLRVPAINVRERVRDHAAIRRLREQVESGLLPLDVAATYHAIEVVDAHRRFDEGHLRGRIVLLFDAPD